MQWQRFSALYGYFQLFFEPVCKQESNSSSKTRTNSIASNECNSINTNNNNFNGVNESGNSKMNAICNTQFCDIYNIDSNCYSRTSRTARPQKRLSQPEEGYEGSILRRLKDDSVNRDEVKLKKYANKNPFDNTEAFAAASLTTTVHIVVAEEEEPPGSPLTVLECPSSLLVFRDNGNVPPLYISRYDEHADEEMRDVVEDSTVNADPTSALHLPTQGNTVNYKHHQKLQLQALPTPTQGW